MYIFIGERRAKWNSLAKRNVFKKQKNEISLFANLENVVISEGFRIFQLKKLKFHFFGGVFRFAGCFTLPASPLDYYKNIYFIKFPKIAILNYFN